VTENLENFLVFGVKAYIIRRGQNLQASPRTEFVEDAMQQQHAMQQQCSSSRTMQQQHASACHAAVAFQMNLSTHIQIMIDPAHT